MSPAPIRAHIPQPRYVRRHFPPQVVFYLQPREFGVDIIHGLRVEGTQTRGGVDV